MKEPLLVLLLSGFCTICKCQPVVYVDVDQTNWIQDGKTWTTAFHDLQLALNNAQPNDEIWVAEGAYFPTSDNDRGKSFIMKNKVTIYGGFSGSETFFTQREPLKNETILSGNIGDPFTNADNSFQIVKCIGVDSTTVLDGFTIEGANYIGGTSLQSIGGGICITGETNIFISAPTIRNCFFKNNFSVKGGAMAIISDNKKYAIPKIENCSFSFNSGQSGGAIYVQGDAIKGLPFNFVSCKFTDNKSSISDGGAIAFSQCSYGVRLYNCQFERDTSLFALGGAVSYFGKPEPLQVEFCKVEIIKCSFIENYSTQGGAIMFYNGLTVPFPYYFDIDIVKPEWI